MFYVYYNKAGDLLSVTNELHDNKSYLPIDQATYVEFVSGKNNLIDYFIELHDGGPPTFLRKDAAEIFNIDKSVHELKKIHQPKQYLKNSFYIIQDLKKKKWQAKANLSGPSLTRILHHKYMQQYKRVYITQAHNPNILIGELTIDMQKFTKKPLFDISVNDPSIVSWNDVSLYCPVINEQFYHVVKEC
jgi:hypothetical protein